MVTVTVTTDAAESPLATHLESLGVTVQRTRLDLGDVAIEANGKKLIVERKGWADWAASVQDGRYKEQKARFVGSGNEHEFLVYLIEGSLVPMEGATRGMSNRALNAAILKTQLRDNHHVIRSHDTRASAAIVQYLASVMEKDELSPSASNLVGAAGSAKKRKRDNLADPHVLRIEALAVVPGMSHAKAEAVLAQWPTLGALASVTNVADVANVSCGSRRIGKVVAERLIGLFSERA